MRESSSEGEPFGGQDETWNVLEIKGYSDKQPKAESEIELDNFVENSACVISIRLVYHLSSYPAIAMA